MNHKSHPASSEPLVCDTPDQLARRIASGDRLAESELVKTYSRGLMRMLRQRTKDTQLAEDLHQDTFCVVLQRLRSGSINDPTRLVGFMHQTAINLHIAVLRKEKRRQTFADSDRVAFEPDESSNQLRALLREESDTAVRLMISGLRTARDQEVLRCFYINEQRKSEICESLNLSEKHFDRVIHRARARFRTLIEARRKKSDEY
ncbi:MAG: sigma-70 family RNA polymerase sigma factor [Pseudomonadota bacterium]